MLEGHEDLVLAIVLMKDGKNIISGSVDKTIRIWDLESGVCPKIIEALDWSVNTIVVAPDAKRIVSSSWDHTTRIWDVDSRSCIKTIKKHEHHCDIGWQIHR